VRGLGFDGESLDHRGESVIRPTSGPGLRAVMARVIRNELVVGQLGNEADRGIAQERVESALLPVAPW
jgi:hypothetical protein